MMLGDLATFARPRGAKDKKPRKRRYFNPASPKAMIGVPLLAGATVAVPVTAVQMMNRREEARRVDSFNRITREVNEINRRGIRLARDIESGSVVDRAAPKATGYKGLSRAQKTAKVKGRIAMMKEMGFDPKKSKGVRRKLAKVASAAARKRYLKYSGGNTLAMFKR